VEGTEMNSPGQKFVDDFASKELEPLAPVFLRSAHIIYAHSVLQRKCDLGYTSEWANKNFENVAGKNKFFEEFGNSLQPEQEDNLSGLSEDITPKDILAKIKN
jgi:hypothetical protein